MASNRMAMQAGDTDGRLAHRAAGSCAYAPTYPGQSGEPAGNAPLKGLAGSSVADRFRAWTGRSGRRYIFSVYRLDDGLDRVPTEAAAVVVAVVRGADGSRRPLWVEQTGDCAKRFMCGARVLDLAAQAGIELHLHLLAADEGERRAIAIDLRSPA